MYCVIAFLKKKIILMDKVGSDLFKYPQLIGSNLEITV